MFDEDYATPAAGMGAVKLMKSMTEKDFPETDIDISDDGKISKK